MTLKQIRKKIEILVSSHPNDKKVVEYLNLGYMAFIKEIISTSHVTIKSTVSSIYKDNSIIEEVTN
jgi:hypothetical protein